MIIWIVLAIAGAIICGLPRSGGIVGLDFFPLGIVFIVFSFVMILGTIIEEMINKFANKNKETNVIINIPKKEKVVEKDEESDMAENWELVTDPITKLLQDELFGKENSNGIRLNKK